MRQVTDWQLWAALLVAPLVWFGLYLALQPVLNLNWSRDHPWLFFKWVLVLPILEELVFRGLLQDFFQRRIAKRWGAISAANLITSLIFMGVHFISHPLLWATLVIFPSLVFGYFRERHDSLSSPIALHIFYNAGYFLFFI